MRQITVRRAKLQEFAEAFDLGSKVTINERDDAKEYQTFKYRAARNWKTASGLAKDTEAKQRKIAGWKPKFREYVAKHNALLVTFADKDKDGEPIISNKDPENPSYRTSKENEVKYEKAQEELAREYRKAIREQVRQDRDANAVLENKVTLKLMTFDFWHIPKNIAGGWYERLKPMLENYPEDS